MERLRNALAFPLYATAAWLLWVLSQQVAPQSLAGALAGGVLLAFGLWWLGQPLRRAGLKALIAGSLIAASLGLLTTTGSGGEPRPTMSSVEAWGPDRVSALQKDGRAVLVNFTAAWCITCKVNERVALDTEAVREALETDGVAYLKGDWTRRDPAITAELERHGRSGVPLYLLFPAGQGKPAVLPQILTEGLVLQALADIH
jgi:thiol:disulfide interchange protein DsbD